MKNITNWTARAFCSIFLSMIVSCGSAGTTALAGELVFVGSTPGDPEIRTMLSIDAEGVVDFIRWKVTFSNNEPKTYSLDLHYGEAQPNTLGFKAGGKRSTLEGAYTISKSPLGNVYELKNDRSANIVSFLRLNDNLFHILTANKKLMVGNGGWSYTLNRKDPLGNDGINLPAIFSADPHVDKVETVFDGRTPCVEIARNYNFAIEGDCFKLKWRIVFRRDPETKKPSGYSLYRTGHRQNEIEGTWTVQKGIPTNPEAIVYRLDPEKPQGSMSFLVGDENVLFFLDKEFRLFTGNEDFSFTLNRRPA